jgi:hypothetical protein
MKQAGRPNPSLARSSGAAVPELLPRPTSGPDNAKPAGAAAVIAGLASYSRKKPLGAGGALVLLLVIAIGITSRWAGLTPNDPSI